MNEVTPRKGNIHFIYSKNTDGRTIYVKNGKFESTNKKDTNIWTPNVLESQLFTLQKANDVVRQIDINESVDIGVVSRSCYLHFIQILKRI